MDESADSDARDESAAATVPAELIIPPARLTGFLRAVLQFGFIAFGLAMVCPFEPAEKQALLEAPTDVERAAALLTLLQMGALAQDTPGGRSLS